MSELELLFWLFVAVLAAGTTFAVGLTAVTAWTATRVFDRLFAAVAPVRTGSTADIRDVETHLATLAETPHLDSGVVRRVVPESRREGGRLFWRFARTPGVRFDVALPMTDPDATLPVWTPLPDRLTGTTPLERVAAACGVSPDRLSDAVGEEIPVRRVGDRWVVGAATARTARTPGTARTPETEDESWLRDLRRS
ncbi:hypothetical protein [Halogeometricum limi]|uniref:Uncharacterized protein n=1 Tax=Halogeometricum limi TaxID=555875 RepID=A0A1I6I0A4_9EURY|nr:hypothetical protein [Halogeometricum limi]SFR60132.1 hypothetical protein SAMN04488124_2661 [Halogeometricum limi]